MLNEGNNKRCTRKKLTDEQRAHISACTKEAMQKIDMKAMCAKRRSMKGSASPRWKGGVAPLRDLLAYRCMKELRPMILERDGYRCSMCNGEASTIHHIVRLADIKDRIIKENPNLSLKDDVGLLSDLVMKAHDREKVISLCKVCHKRIHYLSKQIRSNSVNSRTDNTEPSPNIIREGVESRRATSVGIQNEGVLQSREESWI